MTEQFLLYLIWSIMLFILGLISIWAIGLQAASRKLIKSSNQLSSEIARARKTPIALVEKGLGSMGIEGILDELGIDIGILNNPIVKGLVSKYAPKIIEQMSKTGKVDKISNYGLDSL